MVQEERHRERETLSELLTTYGGWKQYNGTCANLQASTEATTIHGTMRQMSTVETVDDVVTFDFLGEVKRGNIINNPFSKSTIINYDKAIPHKYHEVRWQPINCSGISKQRYIGGRVTDSLISSSGLFSTYLQSYLSIPSLDIESLKDQASTQAWANADLSKAAVLVSMKEARETVKGITDVFVGVVKVFREIRRLQFAKLLGRLSPKELANRYMEVRYALRPMVYDVCQIIDAATNAAWSVRQTFRGHKAGEASANDQQTTNLSGYWMTAERSASITVDVRSGVLARIDDLHSLNTWGADAILESAWDLIPLSFVVDWFFNVSDVIQAWTPETGLTPLASWCKVVTTKHQSLQCIASGLPTGTNPVDILNDMTEACISRTEITTVRTPKAERWNLPRFSLNLDTLKLLDLTIIAKKLLGR